jgi:hypothetical protein
MGRGRAAKTIERAEAAYAILSEIQPATVRAVCYRLFVQGLIPSMAKRHTDAISRLLTEERESGEIPWEWIVDETRGVEGNPMWEDAGHFAESVKGQYRRDRWQDQDEWVEVWSEKGTVRGTLAPVLNEFGVSFRVLHGYSSATVVNDVAKLTQYHDRQLTVLYVGDWDPSGMGMSEFDLPTRLERYGGDVNLVRIAIASEDHGLPFFSVHDKRNDPRYKQFLRHYGEKCFEIDALSPPVLRQRVRDYITCMLDTDAWERAGQIEQAEMASIEDVFGQLASADEARSFIRNYIAETLVPEGLDKGKLWGEVFSG